LTVDSDFMTVTKIDDSAKTLANDMANFSGERLLLEPGVNTLRLLDARDGAVNPETASCGVIAVKLNYRARYL
jgi:phage-related protein